MAGQQIQVDILGHTYTIRGEADEKYIRTLAAYVDDKMKTVRARNVSAPPLEAAVMVAINIADELFKERSETKNIAGIIEDSFQELTSVLHG